MTLKEFFQRLPKDGWWLTEDGKIRRGTSRTHINSSCQCPISSIDARCQCPISSLEGLPAGRYQEVAGRIGLDHDVSTKIADAADNDCDTPTKARIRRRLLSHCGLT